MNEMLFTKDIYGLTAFKEIQEKAVKDIRKWLKAEIKEMNPENNPVNKDRFDLCFDSPYNYLS